MVWRRGQKKGKLLEGLGRDDQGKRLVVGARWGTIGGEVDFLAWVLFGPDDVSSLVLRPSTAKSISGADDMHGLSYPMKA